MIKIIYDKEHKKTAKVIYNKLKTRGLEPVLDTNDCKKIKIAIIILSKENLKSDSLITEYEKCYEKAVQVIPFIISDLDYSLLTKFFLVSHDWINAFDNPQDKAIDALIQLIREIIQPTKRVIQPQERNQKPERKTKDSSNYKIVAVVLFFIVLIAGMIYYTTSETGTTPLKIDDKPENLLVGRWRLANVQDNIQRTPQEYKDFLSALQQLRKNFLMVFNSDGTFARYGFSSKAETGTWTFDPVKMQIFIAPPNSKNKDMLSVNKLTRDSLIFTVAAYQDSLHIITNKFYLYREQK